MFVLAEYKLGNGTGIITEYAKPQFPASYKYISILASKNQVKWDGQRILALCLLLPLLGITAEGLTCWGNEVVWCKITNKPAEIAW